MAEGISTSWCVKRIDGLQNSPYVEYNCVALSDAAESESDLVLVASVRLEILVDSMNRHFFLRDPENDGAKGPVWMHVRSMREELHSYWRSLSPELQRNSQYSSRNFQIVVEVTNNLNLCSSPTQSVLQR